MLPTAALYFMRLEFPAVFDEMFLGAKEQLKKDLVEKLGIISEMEMQNAAKNEGGGGLKAKLAMGFLGGL